LHNVTVKSNWVFRKYKFHAELSCILQEGEIETIRFTKSVRRIMGWRSLNKGLCQIVRIYVNLLLMSQMEARHSRSRIC